MLAAADTEEGTAVTRAIFASLRREGTNELYPITAFGGLNLQIVPCLQNPSERDKALKSISTRTEKLDSEYYIHRINSVNPALVHNPEWAIAATRSIDILRAVIPIFPDSADTPGMVLVFDDTPDIYVNPKEYYVDQLFQLRGDDNDYLFRPKTHKKSSPLVDLVSSSDDEPLTAAVIKDITRTMDKKDDREVRQANVINVYWAVGAWGAAGTYVQGFKGDEGVRTLVEGYSHNTIDGFTTEDDAREAFSEIYPGIYSDEQMTWLRRLAKKPLTNLDTDKAPNKLGLPRNGRRPGKKGYTFINSGDDLSDWYRNQIIPGHPYYDLNADEACKIVVEGKFEHFVHPIDDFNDGVQVGPPVEDLKPAAANDTYDSDDDDEDYHGHSQLEFAADGDNFAMDDEPEAVPAAAKKRDASPPDESVLKTPSKRGRMRSPMPDTAQPPRSTATAFQTPTKSDDKSVEVFETPMKTPTSSPTIPPAEYKEQAEKRKKDFCLRICVPPFATLTDLQSLIKPLLPEESEWKQYEGDHPLSMFQLCSHVESPASDTTNYPTYGLIWSPTGEIVSHLYNQLVGSSLFNVKCSPVHLRPEDINDYTPGKENRKRERMSDDSLVIWMKCDCPVPLQKGLAEILIKSPEDPQVMMARYQALKSSGTTSSSS